MHKQGGPNHQHFALRGIPGPMPPPPPSVPVPPGGGGDPSDLDAGYPAMGYRCVCTTGTIQHKAEVRSKRQREKLFSDMS